MLAIAAVMEARGVRPFGPYLGSPWRRAQVGASPRAVRRAGRGIRARSLAGSTFGRDDCRRLRGPRRLPGHDLPEVVTVPFTFFASAGSVVHAGAVPRFVDIEPEAYGMDAGAVATAITPRTVAVLPVHLFGQPCDIAEVVQASGSVPVVEDNAQAIGAMYGPSGRRRGAGSIGLAGSLSFFPTKNLGAAGDAGMVLTDDDPLAERLRKIRVHGGQQMYHHETVGWNSRLDELQAGVLNVKLSRLEAWSQARREHAGRYDVLLGETGLVSRGLVLPPVRKADRTHIFHQYVVRVPKGDAGRDRDGLRRHLTEAGIGSGVYYPVPLHLQECFRELGYARGDFPVSEKAAEEVLALPVYPSWRPISRHSSSGRSRATSGSHDVRAGNEPSGSST